MGTDKFDIIKCQRLYVSGADVIENTDELIEVTTAIKSVAQGGTYQSVRFTASVAQGAENVATVTLQAIDGAGASLAGVRNVNVFLSDSATGVDLASTFTPTAITATTGKIIASITALLHLVCQTDATGKVVLSLTDALKAQGYVAIVNPQTGAVSTLHVVTGSYGTGA